MIAVFAALDGELASLRRQSPRQFAELRRLGAATIREGAGVLLVRTGMGRARAQEAADAVLRDYPVASVLSIGFAGALSPSLEAGDVLLCERVLPWLGPPDGSFLPQDARTTIGEAVATDAGLLGLAEEVARAVRINYRRGQALTFPKVVAQPETKARLGRLSGAHAVEMESAWIGAAARAKGVPFLALRVITDPLSETVPPLPLAAVSSSWRALAWLSPRPWHVPGTLRLAGHVWRAQRNLATVTGALLRRLRAASQAEVAP